MFENACGMQRISDYVSNSVLGQKQMAVRTSFHMHVLFNGSFVQEICMNVCDFPSGSICVFGSYFVSEWRTFTKTHEVIGRSEQY